MLINIFSIVKLYFLIDNYTYKKILKKGTGETYG